MQVCQHAKDLILEIKHAKNIPSYNNDKMTKVSNETHQIYRDLMKKIRSANQDDLKDPSVTASIAVSNEIIQRNKRMALAYLYERVKRIEDVWWTRSSVLPEDVRPNLSRSEKEYFEGYDELMDSYSRTMDVDIASDLLPPEDFMVEVRILKDCGEIVLKSGQFVNLKKSTIFMRRSDAEGIIQQGLAVILDK
eukprot:jgi/Bigna1/73385/fgenesh1_pg.24_\